MANQPKSYRKFLAGSVSAALVASAITPVAAAETPAFSDVPADSSHAENIAKAVELNLLKGFEDGTFKPNQSITRGQVVKTLARYLESIHGEVDTSDVEPFADVPADYADQELYEASLIVKKFDAFQGADGKLLPNNKISRQAMAKVLVNAFGLEELTDVESKVTDLDQADEWAREYIQILSQHGVTNVEKFNPKSDVSRAQYASFLVRAVEAAAVDVVTVADIEEVTVVDTNTIEVVFNGELTEVNKEDFTIEGVEIESVEIKDEAAAAEEAVKTVVVIKTKTALEEGKSYTVAFKGETSEKTTVEVPVFTPAVESVSANNLKTVTITFNKAVDKDTVDVDGTSNDTVKVYRNGSSTMTTLADSQLSEDGKTLVLEFTSLGQSDELKIVVDGLKTKDGVKFEKYETTVTVTDTTVPTLNTITVLNSKTIEVYTSEPIQPLAVGGYSSRTEVKVDGVSLPVKVTNDALNSKLVLEFGSKIAVGEHTLTLDGFKDYANFKAAKAEFAFEVIEDTTAPEIVKAEALDKDTVKITFSEPVDVLGTIEVNGVTSFSSTTWSTDKKVLTLKATDLFDLGSTVESKIKYKGTKDVEGNEVTEEKTFVFQAADDTTKPVVSSVEVKDGNAVEVTFSESLSATGTVTVKNDKGTVIVNKLAVPALNSDNKVTFTSSQLGLSNNGGTYTLIFEGAKDNSVRKNEADKYETTITAKDIQKPTADVYYKEAGKLTVVFDEEMDAATLANKANYIVNLGSGDQYLSAITGAEVSVAPDNKSVVLTIPGSTASTTVKVQGVKDVAGNIVSNFNVAITPTDISGYTFIASDISTVEAISKNQVKVTLTSKTFSTVDPSTFVLYDGLASNSNSKLVATKAELSADKKSVTLTLNANLDGIAQVDGGAVYLGVASGNELTKDQYGKPLTIDPATRILVADKIAPELTKIEKVANTKNQFKLVFSEEVTEDTTGLVQNDLVIKKSDGTILSDSDYTVSNLETAKSNELVVTITGGVDDGLETFTVSMPNSRYLHDGTVGGAASTGNVLKPFAETTVSNVEIDLTAPAAVTFSTLDSLVNGLEQGAVVISGTAEAGSTVAISLDDTNSGTAAETATVIADASGNFTATVDISSLDDGTITVSATATDANGNTSTATTDTFVKDATAATATVDALATNDENGFEVDFDEDVTTVTIDDASGVAEAVTVTFDSATDARTATFTVANTGATDGENFTFTITDVAGNTTTYLATFDGTAGTWSIAVQ
jgi:trimeric autotransporter adhesin